MVSQHGTCLREYFPLLFSQLVEMVLWSAPFVPGMVTVRTRVFLRFRFGDRKEILRDRLEEFERPFSIDVISGHYI